MTLDAPLRKVAKSVLAKFGTDVTIRRVTGTSYSTTTRSMVPTTSDTVIKGRLDEYLDRELGNIIRVGDRKLTIAASDLSYTPTVDDKVVIATLVYEVIRVQSDIATDAAAIYIMQIRR